MNGDEASGRVRGATEALSVVRARPRAQRSPLGDHARALLAGHVDARTWNAAGLPALPPREDPVPVSGEAVVGLARLVVYLHCLDLPLAERPAVWKRLEAFFARRLPASAPELVRLRERVCHEHLGVGRASPDVIAGLEEILEFHREVHGEDSYLAGLTRGNLSVAYRDSGDLARAAALIDAEARTRAQRFGPYHPFTMVTRCNLVLLLLLQAEATDDEERRHAFARRALGIINDVRPARDRMYGMIAPNATNSRRYEGRALLLLGELDRAQACLEHALTFQRARDGQQESYTIGQTHLLLARVYAARGNRDQAMDHARRAWRILSAHIPDGTDCAQAAALARELAAQSGVPLKAVPRWPARGAHPDRADVLASRG